MSFAEKITGLLARPNQLDPAGAASDAPWYMKYGGRLLGIVGSFLCLICGLYNAMFIILFSVKCLISGILQMLLGFVVMALEAPICFICIEQVSQVADKVDARPMWNRAVCYCALAVIPVILCPGFASVIPCGLIFMTGAIYGMMSLGKKASAADMRQAAVNSGMSGTPTTNDRAGIVNNAQPFSFTGAVGTDSNV